ncbi:MAG: hypothetical protein MUF43_13860, partial [Flavobacterium sp.]|nr:hypothetical protein [Flavobacterium sp.]
KNNQTDLKIEKSDSFIFVYEISNNFGNIYKFDKNENLIEYMFKTSKNTFSYSERFDLQTKNGNPILYYEFSETKDKKIVLFIYYFSLFKEYDLYLCKDDNSKKLTVLKFDKLTNIYYSSVLLNKYTINNANDINFVLKGTLIDCNQKNQINEVIKYYN